VAFAFVLLQVFSQIGGVPGEIRIFTGHFVIILPYIVRNTVSVLHGFNWSLEEAATSLGAGPVHVFFKVTLPVAKPGVMAGALPLIHTHSFLALGLASLGIMVYDWIHGDPDAMMIRRKRRYRYQRTRRRHLEDRKTDEEGCGTAAGACPGSGGFFRSPGGVACSDGRRSDYGEERDRRVQHQRGRRAPDRAAPRPGDERTGPAG
jgi:hypothetical protein